MTRHGQHTSNGKLSKEHADAVEARVRLYADRVAAGLMLFAGEPMPIIVSKEMALVAGRALKAWKKKSC